MGQQALPPVVREWTCTSACRSRLGVTYSVKCIVLGLSPENKVFVVMPLPKRLFLFVLRKRTCCVSLPWEGVQKALPALRRPAKERKALEAVGVEQHMRMLHRHLA